MTIDEATRRKLSNRLREVLGKSQADALMTLLPNQPLPELATREDVAAMTTTLRAEFRAEMEQRFAAVDRQFGELKGELGELKGEFGELKGELGELKGEFGELKGELGELKGELKAEFARQTVTLALTLGSLIIAMLGTILTLGFTGAFA